MTTESNEKVQSGPGGAGGGVGASEGTGRRPHARSAAETAEEATGPETGGGLSYVSSSRPDPLPPIGTVRPFPTSGDLHDAIARFGRDSDGAYWVSVSPGSVSLKHPRPPIKVTARTRSGQTFTYERSGYERCGGSANGSMLPTRGWSKSSRNRMIQRYAQLDYRPLYEQPGDVLLVTLTYPGDDWERWAASPKLVKAHLAKFRDRLRKAGVSPVGLWKLEFQRRGAPHFHLLLSLPEYIVGWRRREWLSQIWYEIVGSGDARHLRAGTAIDWAESSRLSNPAAVAVYFAQHSLPGQRKGYQHQIPDEWQALGERFRFWGKWGLKPLTAQQQISGSVGVEARRILRGWYGSTHEPRRVRVTRVDRRTGQIRCRWVRRPPRLRSLQGAQGATVLARQAPRFMAKLADASTGAAVAGPTPSHCRGLSGRLLPEPLPSHPLALLDAPGSLSVLLRHQLRYSGTLGAVCELVDTFGGPGTGRV